MILSRLLVTALFLLCAISDSVCWGVDIAEVEASIADSNRPLIAENTTRRKKKRREAQATASDAGEQDVDLSAMETEKPAASSPHHGSGNPHGGATGTEPHFSVLFDLILGYRPGRENFSFMNFHPLLFFEIVPTPDIVFQFEVNPSPRYFELDYNLTKHLTIRIGRIFIPFDDMNPHNRFGGMINTSGVAFGSTRFLPDIWAELGIGAKYIIIDERRLKIESHLYVVNGFGANGAGTGPNFDSVTGPENNDNKAVGGRISTLIAKIAGIGLSFYTNRWSDQTGSRHPLLMLGADFHLRFPSTELHLGYTGMTVGFEDGSSYARTGTYLELQQKFGDRDQWKLIARAGTQDTDDRVVNDSDLLVVGGGIRWKPNLLTLCLEHYQDIKQVDGKAAYAFTYLRTVIQL